MGHLHQGDPVSRPLGPCVSTLSPCDRWAGSKHTGPVISLSQEVTTFPYCHMVSVTLIKVSTHPSHLPTGPVDLGEFTLETYLLPSYSVPLYFLFRARRSGCEVFFRTYTHVHTRVYTHVLRPSVCLYGWGWTSTTFQSLPNLTWFLLRRNGVLGGITVSPKWNVHYVVLLNLDLASV